MTDDSKTAQANAIPPRPAPLGLEPSFGFGDRLGLATPGHVAALRRTRSDFLPIFAQQSIREMSRTARTPEQVMHDALAGSAEAGYIGRVGNITRPRLRELPKDGKGLASAREETRRVYFAESGGYVDCAIYDRHPLLSQHLLSC